MAIIIHSESVSPSSALVQPACRLPAPSLSIPTVSTGPSLNSLQLRGYGADYINDGVQGASLVFYNTYAMFDKLGFKASPIGIQISFGRDPDNDFWSEFRSDIQKFGRVLKIVKALKPLFAVISVNAVLRMFRFSRACPLLSYRVFMDPSMRLFEYSSDSFLASISEICALPHLSLLYQTWAEVQSRGNVALRTQQQVIRVLRGDHVQLWSRSTGGTDQGQYVREPLGKEVCEEFDELILAVDANSALMILEENASWLEKKILGNVKYLCDVSVTHSDLDYTNKYYRLHYDPSLNSSLTDKDAKKAYELAQKEFAPLYFIRSYPDDKKKVEMSFDLTNYQPQFKGEHSRGPQSASSVAPPPGPPPSLSPHVLQTISLDRDESSEKWSKGDISPEHVIYVKW